MSCHFLLLCLLCVTTACCDTSINENNQLINKPAEVLGLTRDAQTSGIFWSNKISIEKHPYQVSIILYEDRSIAFAGSGTILSKKWVLTAGVVLKKCRDIGPIDDLVVVAGSENAVDGQKYNVLQGIFHPEFGVIELDNDVALLQIDGCFEWSSRVKPAKLPTSRAKPRSNLIVSGWGDPYNNFREGTMKVIREHRCKKFYNEIEFTNTMTCAYNKGKTTPCKVQGDLGDPFVKNGELKAIFIYISVHGFCSVNAYPAILADIASPSILDWIKEIIDT